MLNWLKQLSIKKLKDLIKQSSLKSPGGVVDIFSIRDCNLRTHMRYAQSTYIIHACKHAVLVCSASASAVQCRRKWRKQGQGDDLVLLGFADGV